MNDDFLDAALKRQTQAPATDERRGRARAGAACRPAAAAEAAVLAAADGAARLAIRAGLAAARRARRLRRARLLHRHCRHRPPDRRLRRSASSHHRRRLRRGGVRARSVDRSAAMSDRPGLPAMTRGSLALAAARLAGAQSVLRRRRARHGDPRAGAAALGPRRVRARRAARRRRCRRPTPSVLRAQIDGRPPRRHRRPRRAIITTRATNIRDVVCGRSRSMPRPCAPPWRRRAPPGRLSIRSSRACSPTASRKCRRPAAMRLPTGRRTAKPAQGR